MMVAHSDQVCSYLKGAQGIQGLTLCFLGEFCTVRVPPGLYVGFWAGLVGDRGSELRAPLVFVALVLEVLGW